MRTGIYCFVLAVAICLMHLAGVGLPAARGQAASTGAIVGSVVDPSGSVIPGAEVKVANTATGATQVVHTNAAGLYDVEALPAAGTIYNLTIDKQGFRTFVSQGVTLHPGERLTV